MKHLTQPARQLPRHEIPMASAGANQMHRFVEHSQAQGADMTALHELAREFAPVMRTKLRVEVQLDDGHRVVGIVDGLCIDQLAHLVLVPSGRTAKRDNHVPSGRATGSSGCSGGGTGSRAASSRRPITRHERRSPMRPDLVPGVNVDLVDVAAGLKMAARLGYDDAKAQMIAEFALMRHRRGEEEGAERTWLSEYPHDMTSWKATLAHAVATAKNAAKKHGPWPNGTRVRFTDAAKQEMGQYPPRVGDARTPRNVRTPVGGADRIYTIDNTRDNLHDVVLRENGERWGLYRLERADTEIKPGPNDD